MKISFRLIQELLSEKCTVQTLDEFVKENSEDLNSSTAVAMVIEDYRYLAVMNQESARWVNFVIVYREGTSIEPIVLKKQSLSLLGLAKLYYETKRFFLIEDFYGVIEKEAEAQDMLPDSLYLQFDFCLSEVIADEKLMTGNVGRNEPCPCNSGKKYKNCHGKPSGSQNDSDVLTVPSGE